jgi:hypothetical protein
MDDPDDLKNNPEGRNEETPAQAEVSKKLQEMAAIVESGGTREQAKPENLSEPRIQEIRIDRIQEFVDRIQRVRGLSEEKPTPEREKMILGRLDEFARVFDDAGIHYVLDGALNISLYGKKFFREHRDIDFSVFSKDVPKLAQALESNGYALFKFPKNADERLKEGVLPHELIRPDEIDISKISRERLFFLKVKDNFQIDTENYECFDIHALAQNENGDVVRPNGTVIPKELYADNPKYETASGRKIQLSHPVILAYFKLLEGRDHDLNDLEYAIEQDFVSQEDLVGASDLLKQDAEKGWDGEKPKIKKAQEWLSQKIIKK